MEQPKGTYAVVRDKDGNRWVRQRTRWRCHDAFGELFWSLLERHHGPLTVDLDTERLSDRLRAERGWSSLYTPHCASCGGETLWTEDHWVCQSCGDEWNPDHGPEYRPPGD